MERRIECVNYIRIFCMILILLFHAKIHFGLNFGNIILNECISIGAIGVVGFFMILGFALRNNYKGMQHYDACRRVFEKTNSGNLSILFSVTFGSQRGEGGYSCF